MTPQVKLNGSDPIAHVSTASPVRAESQEPHKPTYGERQGIAMGWVAIALGIFLLFGGLALWAASVLSAGFGGWLISIAVMGVIVVATVVAVSYFVIRPAR
ncbi:MAG TPA: hypothetical protein VJO13_16955 [Ktedonobacterales bacterium]|nr:hypothetical protein [Ktedonobacterales bacterium]